MSEQIGFFIKGREFLAKPYHYVESGLDNIFLLNGLRGDDGLRPYGARCEHQRPHRAIGLHTVEKLEPLSGGRIFVSSASK
jgi:hypothetical protein